MPQWLYDWHISWLDYYHSHPIAWWLSVAAVVGIYLIATLLQRKS